MTHQGCKAIPGARTINDWIGAGGETIAGNSNCESSVAAADDRFERKLMKAELPLGVRVVVIDEVWLNSAERLAMMLKWHATKYKRVRLWLCGDVGQIVKKKRPWLTASFATFRCRAKVVYLSKNYRIGQGEDVLAGLQTAIRYGRLEGSEWEPVWRMIMKRDKSTCRQIFTAAVSTNVKEANDRARAENIDLISIRQVKKVSSGGETCVGPTVRIGVGSRVMTTRLATDTKFVVRPPKTIGTVSYINAVHADDPPQDDDENGAVMLATNVAVGIVMDDGEAFELRGAESSTINKEGKVIKSTSIFVANATALTVHMVQGMNPLRGRVYFNANNAMEPCCFYVYITRLKFLKDAASNGTPSRVDELAMRPDQRQFEEELRSLAVNFPARI